ncbi:hypothetical protein CCR82_11435 [Halochromatium salexigens]|uniref:Uncharacterized protein n=1 Tax=Halochromatium salexigens TaxID=49447 RepID=A0AAJ0UGY9_HALSE|nr:hypothetical protein [Halochromatium salexigens]
MCVLLVVIFTKPSMLSSIRHDCCNNSIRNRKIPADDQITTDVVDVLPNTKIPLHKKAFRYF